MKTERTEKSNIIMMQEETEKSQTVFIVDLTDY